MRTGEYASFTATIRRAGYTGAHRAPRPVRGVAVRRAALGAATAAALAGSGAMTALPASAATVSHYNLDRNTSAYAKELLGHRYVFGGNSPAGFDCSGLAQYVYGHFGYAIPRTAQAQYDHFRKISESQAWGGDLVFFHSGSPSGPVYHVGIWEGGGHMVSALNPSYGVQWTPVSWGGTYYTFGTISH